MEGDRTSTAGLLLQADQQSSNGTVYTKVRQAALELLGGLRERWPQSRVGAQEVLRRAVQAYHRQCVLAGSALGSLGHPAPCSSAYHRQSPESASHQVHCPGLLFFCQRYAQLRRLLWQAARQGTPPHPQLCRRFRASTVKQTITVPSVLQVLALWWRGDCLCGVLEILQTQGGKRIRDVYAEGELLGASVRAWTSLASEHGRHVASADLQIIAYAPARAFAELLSHATYSSSILQVCNTDCLLWTIPGYQCVLQLILPDTASVCGACAGST